MNDSGDVKNLRAIKQFEAMIQVASLYYIENMSQQQIADTLGMSRSNVSRMLINCRESGIVEIRIREAAIRTYEVKAALMERFGLQDAVIVPWSRDDANVPDIVGRTAAEYVSDCMADGMTVGIGWGSGIHSMVSALKPSHFYKMEVIQLMGGTSIAEIYKDGVQLAVDFARMMGGRPHILNAPLLVSNKKTRDLFIEENDIRHHLQMAEKIDAAIVTVGTNDPSHSTMVSAGYISQERSQELWDEGLYTNLLGQHIDLHGNPGASDLNDRVVGIELDDFRQIPLRIGVACADFKVRQIASALAGGFINALVTDEETARAVRELAEKYNLENAVTQGQRRRKR